MKILVTGGAGYLGAHVATQLLEAGHKVRVYDDFSTGSFKRLSGKFHNVIEGSILDKYPLIQAMDGQDAVIHLAGKKFVDESNVLPIEYYDNNISGTINVLEAMKITGVKKLVFASSAAVYSPVDDSPVSEDSNLGPASVYGITKLMAEEIIERAAIAENFSVTALRYFNLWGCRSNQLKDTAKSNLISNTLELLSAGRLPQIYGTDYPTPDGTAVRDYIHVDDAASATVAAVEALKASTSFSIYNVGSGEGHSIKEVLTTLSSVVGNPIESEAMPRRLGYPSVVASVDKIKAELNWVPKYDLKEMITSTWSSWGA